MGRNSFVKLNVIDYHFFAVEDMAPAKSNLSVLRFNTKHSIDQIREAMRYMIFMYPRLRSLIVPTAFSYKLKILDNHTKTTDVLFNRSFRVEHNLSPDSDRFAECRRDLFNEPFPLQKELPIKILYLPDDPRPALLMSIHHSVTDGKGWFHMTNSILACLNGKKPPLEAVDNPSLLPVLLGAPYYKLPQKLFRSFIRYSQENPHPYFESVVHLSSTPVNFFGAVDLQCHTFSHDITSIKPKLKDFGCTINIFLLSVIAISLSRINKKNSDRIIRIPIQIDLRPYFREKKPIFGNYLYSPTLKIRVADCNDPIKTVRIIYTQVFGHLNRIRRKEVAFPFLTNKMLILMGKTFYTKCMRIQSEKQLRKTQITCNVSFFDNIDSLNSHGPHAQVCEAIATTQMEELFISIFNNIDGKLKIILSFQEAEFTKKKIQNLIESFEQTLGELIGRSVP